MAVEAQVPAQEAEEVPFWRYAAMVLSEGIVVRDRRGRVVFANDAARHLLGDAAGALLDGVRDDRAWRFVRQDGSELPVDELPGMLAMRDAGASAHMIVGIAGGTEKTCWLSTTSTLLARGDRSYLLSAFHDVTDRVEAVRELGEAEGRFRSVAESMLDGLAIYTARRDERGAIVDFMCEYVNASAADNRGIPASEQLGRGLLEIFPELHDQGLFNRIVRVVDTGEPLFLDLPWYESARARGAFEVRVIRLGDGCAVSFRDVTDRRKTEADLRASEARLRDLLRALPVGVALIDHEAKPVFFNDVALELLGRGPERDHPDGEFRTVYGLHRAGSNEPYPIEDMPLVRALVEGVSSGVSDMCVRRPDRDIPIESFAAPLRGADGEITHAISVFRDISERRQREERLADALAELARSNEALNEFAAVAAHDLAEPLRGVAGFVELLRREYAGRLGDDAREWIELVADASRHMRTLIDGLLAYSRVGGGERPSTPVDLGAVARSARDALAGMLHERDASVEIAELPTVPGAAAQLQQLLQNLIANAVKFTAPEVTPRVTIGALPDVDTWTIEVADNGIGIPEDERERVFAPLHRAHDDEHPGSGLGLAICRKIVDHHGGRIWVEPGVAGGSRFLVALPALPASSA